jgi:hypothetical protein
VMARTTLAVPIIPYMTLQITIFAQKFHNFEKGYNA